MSQATPFALDDLILCDYSNWISSLIPNALGLASASVKRSARVGRWPLLAGVERGDKKLTLQTSFGHTLAADREAARLALLQKLNYEREETHRLIGADGVIYGVAPDDVMMACGPMDVYRDTDGAWLVGDLLQRYHGTLGGGWWTEADSGILISCATTNKVLNPSAGAATNYAAMGAATVTTSSDYIYRGNKSFKVVTTAAANDGISLTLGALANAVHYATIRVYGAWATQQLSLDNANWNAPTLLGTDGAWNIYGYSFLAAQANASTTLYIRQSDATARTLYIDCIQVEPTAYPTPYVDGALGLNHTWSGAAHASTSSRGAATLIFSNPFGSTAGTLAMTWTPTADNTGATRYLFSEGNLKGYFNSTDDKLYFTDGTNTISTAALTFSGLTAQRLAFTWSASGLKIYRNGSSAASGVTYTAPTLGEFLYIGSDTAGVNQAGAWIDDLVVLSVEATTTAIAQFGAGALSRARWLDVVCEASQAMDDRDRGLVSTLNVDDDIRWRARDGDVAFWRIYDGSSIIEVENLGDDDAYPIFHLTTRTAKTAGISYSRYIFIVWKASGSATLYPVRFTLPDLTGKAQADGDDIRVTVDGAETDRWLDGSITAYNVWVNLNFSACPSALTLTSQMLAGATVTDITVTGSLTNWPSTGIVLIESEAFVYTGKSGTALTGVTRASKNTTAATHAAATAIYLIQREIIVTYGDATMTAPATDDSYKPAFELDHSTNTSWVYESFGDDEGLRSAAWSFAVNQGSATKYTANRGTTATPWSEAGVEAVAKNYGDGGWKLYNPCGITNANVTNGEYYGQSHLGTCDIKIKSSINGSSYTTGYVIVLTCDATWRAWSNSCALITGAKYVQVKTDIDSYTSGYSSETLKGEFADVTLTLNSSYTPTTTIGAEVSSGAIFAPMITNSTTGESITLTSTLNVDATLTVDTANKSVTLDDGSYHLEALALDATRRDWLRLVTGVNQLTFSDVGTEELEIEIEWDRRYFE